jgi:hypothetical protein
LIIEEKWPGEEVKGVKKERGSEGEVRGREKKKVKR